MKAPTVGGFALLIIFGSGCRTKPVPPANLVSKYPGAVRFAISSDRFFFRRSPAIYHATYASQGKIAKFTIELESPHSNDSEAFVQVGFGRGSILSESGSDSGVLIADLSKALEAKGAIREEKHAKSLPFTYASFGDRQTEFDDGSLGPNPPGHWTPYKVFLGEEGKDDAEVFLNLDPTDGIGEFSIKDTDYGDAVVRKLSTVL